DAVVVIQVHACDLHREVGGERGHAPPPTGCPVQGGLSLFGLEITVAVRIEAVEQSRPHSLNFRGLDQPVAVAVQPSKNVPSTTGVRGAGSADTEQKQGKGE